ncbi:MAG TPA: hypothetical protein VLC53_17125 [Myxococcota bacterium]|nr:hypothetical protein [Myxococcota bacterium]
MKTALHQALERIFADCPELSGFAMDDAQEPNFLDVTFTPGFPDARPEMGALVDALRELIDEDPEAVDLLRGHTFARTLH